MMEGDAQMKRAATFLLAACVAAGAFAGCGEAAASTSTPGSESVPVSSSEAAPTPEPTPHKPEQGRVELPFPVYDDVNPYTGLPKGEGYPQGRRGVAVMINNVKGALPQSGINSADILYEMVTEGGVTRLMALYRDYESMPAVGPIRSARDQHVQLMLPLEPLYAHIGGSSYALDLLEIYRYTGSRAIDGKYKNFYWIDQERRKTMDQDYCVYTDGPTLAAALEKFGFDTASTYEPPQAFYFGRYDEPDRVLEGGAAHSVYIRFSGYTYSEFAFDEGTGRYMKYEFGGPQVDEADGGAQYGADNLLVLFTDVEKYPGGILSKVDLSGQGYGYYFCNNSYEKVRWLKGAPNDPLRIVALDGSEQDLVINPGTTYVAVVGLDQFPNFKIDGEAVD